MGIDAQVQVKDWAVITIPKTTALILGGGIPDEPDDDVYMAFTSGLGEEGTNYSGYRNPRVDELLERGRTTMDSAARKAIYQELQRVLTEDPPYNYLVYLKHVYGVREGVTGFKHRIFGHGTSPLWNIEEWDVAGKS